MTASNPFIQREPIQDPKDFKGERKEKMEDNSVLRQLQTYEIEAREAREGGLEPTDKRWEYNIDAFNMRRDYSEKKAWQAKEITPAVPTYCDRFSASLRRAMSQIQEWFTISDPKDPDGALTQHVSDFVRLLLSKSGTNATGQPTRFERTFGQVVLSGTLTAMCLAVTWKGGRLRIEEVDPRFYLPDPTGRNMYRIRKIEIDKGELLRLADDEDEEGKAIWDKEAIENETSHRDMDMQDDRETSTGSTEELSASRKPMVLWEYLCDIIDEDGVTWKRNQLVVLLNGRTIIRGPENNPYWHQRDWVVYHPMLAQPLGAVDGRTYVENFRHLAQTFENTTNMILDAVRMNSMNAFAYNPEYLDDPADLAEGVYPNMAIALSEDAPPGAMPLWVIELGRHLGAEAFNVWQAVRGEMQEAGAQSDLSLGQMPAGETTATEATLSNQGQNALTSAISEDIEDGLLSPMLLLSFYTGLQHLDENAHPEIWYGLTEEQRAMLMAQREEFKGRRFSFEAKGISAMLERSQRVRALLGALNVIGGNPMLAQAFQKEHSMSKLIAMLLEDFNVDTGRLKKSQQEMEQDAMAQAQAQMAQQQAQAGSAPGGPDAGGAPGMIPGMPQGGQTAQNQAGPDPMLQAEGIEGGVI